MQLNTDSDLPYATKPVSQSLDQQTKQKLMASCMGVSNELWQGPSLQALTQIEPVDNQANAATFSAPAPAPAQAINTVIPALAPAPAPATCMQCTSTSTSYATELRATGAHGAVLVEKDTMYSSLVEKRLSLRAIVEKDDQQMDCASQTY